MHPFEAKQPERLAMHLGYAGPSATPADWQLLRQLLRRLQSRPLRERHQA